MNIKTPILSCLLMGVCSFAFGQDTDLATLDTDSNGKVSTDEFNSYVEGKMPGFDKLADLVKQVDADSNGEISQEEFDSRMEKLAAMQEMDGAQEQPEEKSDDSHQGADEDIDAAKATFNKIVESVKDEDWKAASAKMTPEARDDFCFEAVMMAVAFAEMDMPQQIPGISDLQDELQDVVDTFELGELDLDVDSMMQMEMGGETPEEDTPEMEELETKQKEEKEKVLKAIDKDGKRWEVIGAIWDAQSNSPFHMSPLAGEIEESELDGDVCYLTVVVKPEMPGGGGGAQIQVMAPPSIVRIEKTEEGWMYAGRDEERTRKAMEEFMEGMGGMDGGPDFGPDF